MAIAEIERKNPYNPSSQDDLSRRNIVFELIGLVLCGVLGYSIRVYINPEFQNVCWVLLGLVAIYLLFKNLTYGIWAMIFLIGMAPEIKLFGMDNFRYEDLLLPFLLLVWFLRHQHKRESLIESDVFASIRIYVFFITISTIYGFVWGKITPAAYPAMVAYYFKYIEYFVIFWLVLNNIKEKEDLVLIIITTLLVCGIVGVLAYQKRLEKVDEGTPKLIRAYGPQGETPNVLGGYYMFHLMIAFSMLFVIRKMYYKILLFMFLGGIALPFLYTFSRTSFVSLIIGLVITILFVDLRYSIVLLVLAILTPIFFPASALQNVQDADIIVGRYTTILNLFDGEEKVSSWTARWTGWYVYFTRVWNSNPLIGEGVGSIWLGVDSAYIKKFVESGIIGLITFGMILTRLFRVSLEVIRGTKDEVFKSYAIGYVGGLAGILIHAIGVSSFSTIRTAMVFWVFSGMLVATHWMVMREKELMDDEDRDSEEGFLRSSYSFNTGRLPIDFRRPSW